MEPGVLYVHTHTSIVKCQDTAHTMHIQGSHFFLCIICVLACEYVSVTSAGQDYVPVDIPLTFTSNLTSFNVTLEIVGDSMVEGDEVVVAELVVPEGESAVVLKSSRVAITIVDDDSMYSVSQYVLSRKK